MPSMTRRVALAVASSTPPVLALTLALAPAGAAVALPTGGTHVAGVPANDDPPTKPKKPAPKKPAPKKPAPPTWRQYIAQKPRFSAKACAADVTTARALLKKATKKNPPTVECARVLSPLDWSDLSKGALTLQISRVARVAPKGTRTPARGLFVNPGGPGGPAGGFALQLAAVKPALRSTHDVVGVDPRGTGGSTPLPCVPIIDPVPDLRVFTPAARAKAQASYRTFAQRCVASYAKVLPHITTANTVHDQDLVRRLLGYPKADWYGVSGGSWMGAYYSRLHPGTLGRVVVDANTNFATDWRSSFHDFPMGFQRRYDQQFLPWAARHHKQYGLGRTPAAVRATIEGVRAAAGRGKLPGVTPNVLDLVITGSLYDDRALPPLATSLGQTYRGLRAKGRASFAMPQAPAAAPTPKIPAMANVTVRQAIICNDGPFTRTPASFEGELRDVTRRYPLMGAHFGMVVAPCAYWKVATATPVRIAGRPGAPMLMLQNQLDPATPIEGAKAAHAAVPGTRMITVRGAGSHGAFLSAAPGSCLERNTLAYLQRGTFPRADLTCAGSPLPGDTKVYDYQAG